MHGHLSLCVCTLKSNYNIIGFGIPNLILLIKKCIVGVHDSKQIRTNKIVTSQEWSAPLLGGGW